MSSGKLLIQKDVAIGQKIMPVNNHGLPTAVAMNNFVKGDVGVINYDFMYPTLYKKMFLILPGLEKCSREETNIIKKSLKTKGLKNENTKQKKTARKKAPRKKDKRAS